MNPSRTSAKTEAFCRSCADARLEFSGECLLVCTCTFSDSSPEPCGSTAHSWRDYVYRKPPPSLT